MVHFGEIHVFAGPGFVITVRHGPGSELASARRSLEARPDLLKLGAGVGGLGGHRQGRRRLPPGRRGDRGRHRGGREGRLRRRHPGPDRPHLRPEARGDRVPPGGLAAARAPRRDRARADSSAIPDELRRYFRDVADHATPRRRAGQLPARAADQRAAGEPRPGQRQPERGREADLRRSPAIIAVPTFIASVYGMNFDHMPELHWHLGYAFCLALMAVCVVALAAFFRRDRLALAALGWGRDPHRARRRAGLRAAPGRGADAGRDRLLAAGHQPGPERPPGADLAAPLLRLGPRPDRDRLRLAARPDRRRAALRPHGPAPADGGHRAPC